jgi:hypothetical protein
MSLVGNYCKCSDGKWYGEAVWHNPEYTWFVVLDDDDPPELVIEVGAEDSVQGQLPWFKIIQSQGHSHRMFGGKTVSDSEFRPARSYFGELIAVPPPPQKFHSVFESDEEIKTKVWQGVFYDVARKTV